MFSAFAYPVFLWPAAGLALFALLAGLWAQTRPGQGIRVVGQRPWRLGLGLALMLAGLGLGLAGPRWGSPEVPRLTVQVLLDASQSMKAPDGNDQGATRWNAACAVLDRLWTQPLPGVRFGLDLLTGDAIPILPPGEDRPLLRDALRAASPGDLGSVGTSLGHGLAQVAARVEPKIPAVILLLSDGEETLEPGDAAQARALEALRALQLPVYTLCLGSTTPQPVPGREGGEPTPSRAQPELLQRLAEASGGQALGPQTNLAALFQELSQGRRPLPAARSRQPVHPEWGAWMALAGLALWISAAGRPLKAWRMPLLGLLVLGIPAQAQMPLPDSVKAWMAQSALARGDLETARRWKPEGRKPEQRLLAAQIELKSGHFDIALKALEPLLGQGAPRPLPPWRIPALLLAARAQHALGQAEACQELLERALREEPGRPEPVHNLQALLQDPPPPDPRKPPPPPPPRPSQGARQDELEGLRQRMPQKPKPQGGIKDL